MVTAEEYFYGNSTGTPEKGLDQERSKYQAAEDYFGINSIDQPADAFVDDQKKYQAAADYFGTTESKNYNQGFFANIATKNKIGRKSLDFDFDYEKIMEIRGTPDLDNKRLDMLNNAQAAEKKFYSELPEIEASNWAEGLAYNLSEMEPYIEQAALRGAAGKVVGNITGKAIGGGLAAAGGVFIPGPEEIATVPAGTAIGGKIGGKLGGLIGGAATFNMSRKQGKGRLYADLMKDGIDDKIAYPLAHVGGVIYGAIETDQIWSMFGKQVTKKAKSKIIGSALKEVAKRYAKRVIKESAEEGFQGFTMETAKEVAKYLDPEKKNPKAWESISKSVGAFVGDAKESLAPMGVISLFGLGGDIRGYKKDLKENAKGEVVIDEKAADELTNEITQEQTPAPPAENAAQGNVEGAFQPESFQLTQETTNLESNQQQAMQQEKARISTEAKQFQSQPGDLFSKDVGLFDQSAVEDNYLDPAKKSEYQFSILEGISELREAGIEGIAEFDTDQKAADYILNLPDAELEKVNQDVDRFRSTVKSAIDTEIAQAQIAQERQVMNEEQDPIAAFAGSLPKDTQYAGRGVTRQVNRPIYIEANKEGKLPGEYENLNKVKGSKIRFTIDPNKGVPLDMALDEYNNSNPGNEMTEDQFRNQLRVKQQANARPVDRVPTKANLDIENKLAAVRTNLEDAVRNAMAKGETKAAHDINQGLTYLNIAEQFTSSEKDQAFVEDQIKKAESITSQIENKMAAAPKGASWRQVLQQKGIQASPQLQSYTQSLDQNEIPLADETGEDNLTYLHGGFGAIQTAEILEMAENFRKAAESKLNRAKYAFDVEARFNDVGASDTGFAFKNVAGWDEQGTERAIDFAKDMVDLTSGLNKTPAELQFIAEGSVDATTEAEQTFKDKYKKWMDGAYALLKQKGILINTLQDRMLADIQGELEVIASQKSDTFIPDARKQELIAEEKDLIEMRSRVKGMNFVPLARAVRLSLERKIEEAKENGESITKVFDKGSFANFRQIMNRKTVFAKDLYDAGLLTDEDIDPIKQGANYYKYIYGRIGQREIVNSALKDNMIATKKLGDNWVELPVKFGDGKKYFADPVFGEYFTEFMTASHGMNWQGTAMQTIKKATAWMKMRQFYNPLYLTINDIQQSAMQGMFSRNTPKHFKEALRMMKEKDSKYWKFLEYGGASTPDINPMAVFEDRIDDILKKHGKDMNTKTIMYLQGIAEKISDKPIMGTIGTVLGSAEDIYSLSWNVAWQGDRLIRLTAYNEMLSRGFSEKEAAQLVAKTHGDYASVPPSMRKRANLIFFTPTFQIAMTKLYADNIKGVVNWMNNGLKQIKGEAITQSAKDKKIQDHFAKASLYLGAMIIGKNLFMSKYAARTVEFSRKYAFETRDSRGQKKEVIQTFATPFNIPFRYIARFISPFLDKTETEPIKKAINGLSYMANPLWRMAANLDMNMRSDGLEIYNQDDDPKDQAYDIMTYFANEFYPLPGRMKAKLFGEDLYGTKRENKAGIENAEKRMWLEVTKYLTFIYTKELPEIDAARKAQTDVRKFEYDYKNGILKGDPRAKDRMEKRKKNMMERVNARLGREEKKTITSNNKDAAASLPEEYWKFLFKR